MDFLTGCQSDDYFNHRNLNGLAQSCCTPPVGESPASICEDHGFTKDNLVDLVDEDPTNSSGDSDGRYGEQGNGKCTKISRDRYEELASSGIRLSGATGRRQALRLRMMTVAA